MTDTLMSVLLALLALLAVSGPFVLVRLVRRDTFAGDSVRHNPHDELGYRHSPLVPRPARQRYGHSLRRWSEKTPAATRSDGRWSTTSVTVKPSAAYASRRRSFAR